MKKYTVATILTHNLDKIYPAIDANPRSLGKVTELISDILKANIDSIKNPADAYRCIETLKKSESNQSKWLSTFTTWQSAEKVIK